MDQAAAATSEAPVAVFLAADADELHEDVLLLRADVSLLQEPLGVGLRDVHVQDVALGDLSADGGAGDADGDLVAELGLLDGLLVLLDALDVADGLAVLADERW